MICPIVAFTLVLAGTAPVGPQQVKSQITNPPIMTGHTDDLREIRPRSAFAYTLYQVELDSYSPGKYQWDPEGKVRPRVVRCLRAGWGRAFRGCTNEEGQFWDIVGYAVDEPGMYVEEWELYNHRRKTDPAYDPPVLVNQVIRIVGEPVATLGRLHGGDDILKQFDPPLDPERPDKLEALSAELSVELEKQLTPEQVKQRTHQEIPFEVDALSVALQSRVRAYVNERMTTVSRRVAEQYNFNAKRTDGLRVVLLPKPSLLLGVDAWTYDGKRIKL